MKMNHHKIANTEISSQRKIYRYDETILSNCSSIKTQILASKIIPYQVEIHPPPRGKKICWLACSWCYGKYHKANVEVQISGDRLLKIVNEICQGNNKQKENVKKIILSGVTTDPLYADSTLVENLVKTIKKKNLIYGIHSKLLMINDSLIDILVDGGRKDEDYISISLDAGNSKTYNQVHDIQGGNIFEKVLSNINRISEKTQRGLPKIIVNYLLDEKNCDEKNINEAIDLCKSVGVMYLRFSIPQLQFCRNGDNSYDLISLENFQNAEKIIQIAQKENNSSLEIICLNFTHESSDVEVRQRILPCHARWIFPTVGFDGFLYPCCQVATEEFQELRIADLKKDSFWDSYYSYDYYKDRVAMTNSSCKCDRKALEINKKLKT